MLNNIVRTISTTAAFLLLLACARNVHRINDVAYYIRIYQQPSYIVLANPGTDIVERGRLCGSICVEFDHIIFDPPPILDDGYEWTRGDMEFKLNIDSRGRYLVHVTGGVIEYRYLFTSCETFDLLQYIERGVARDVRIESTIPMFGVCSDRQRGGVESRDALASNSLSTEDGAVPLAA